MAARSRPQRNRRWWRIPPEVRRDVIRLAHEGLTLRQIMVRLDLGMGTVEKIVGPTGGVTRVVWETSGRFLSLDERAAIKVGLDTGQTFGQIASRLGRNASTISREVARHGGRDRYRPGEAHKSAFEHARRPKPTKLDSNRRLCDRVTRDMERLWSPRQIQSRLRVDFPDDPEMRVSHETIYKSLYVQGRGELRRELARCLRTGRAIRKKRGRAEKRGRIPDMVMISDRPADVEDRAVPGHWEGDLIIGLNNGSQIGTLVERTTRYVMLLHLPNGRTAPEVRAAMTETVKRLPDTLFKSLTWDQGKEMAEHVQFSIDAGIKVYFCDPHSPWQRGTNENTNGLLRQYFPKSTNLSDYTPQDLQAAADSLNGRPRQTLGWMTPSEKLAELVATTP